MKAKFKPLEWKIIDDSWTVSSALDMSFRLDKHDHQWMVTVLRTTYNEYDIGYYDSEDAAKAACQKHWEELITPYLTE